MGKLAQRRLIRKLDLELFLSQVRPQPSPKAQLEQYTISEAVAANMLHTAAYVYGAIIGKRVLDLGCGTGRLAIGACFLGAKTVVGVDIDREAVRAAAENSRKTGCTEKIQWAIGDIDAVARKFDTVVQNPPFGVQKRAADRRFLEKALEVGDVVFSLHNHPIKDKQLIGRLRASGEMLRVPASPFIERFVGTHNGKVEAVYAMVMGIPRMFDFHMKAKHYFVVDLYVIRKNP